MKLNLRQLLLKYNILFLQVCTIFTLRGGEASMFFFSGICPALSPD